MVIDTSVIVAILFGEGDAECLAEAIEDDPTRLMSGSSVLETSLVIHSELGESGGRELDLLLLKMGIEIIPFTDDQLRVARRAFEIYGKGRHPAGLSFGDCFAYALSKTAGEKLLFKGEDFSKTDVVSCL
jgi:ribonuclease VapC